MRGARDVALRFEGARSIHAERSPLFGDTRRGILGHLGARAGDSPRYLSSARARAAFAIEGAPTGRSSGANVATRNSSIQNRIRCAASWSFAVGYFPAKPRSTAAIGSALLASLRGS